MRCIVDPQHMRIYEGLYVLFVGKAEGGATKKAPKASPLVLAGDVVWNLSSFGTSYGGGFKACAEQSARNGVPPPFSSISVPRTFYGGGLCFLRCPPIKGSFRRNRGSWFLFAGTAY